MSTEQALTDRDGTGAAEVTTSGGELPTSARRHGPTAFGDDFRRFVNLTVTLANTEFKVRYFGSVLGYLWSLMRPLLFFGVLYVFYTEILKLGKGTIEPYAAYLLTGVILWTFFVEATTNAVECLVGREGLLRKMRFPRLVIPLSVVLTALYNLGMNFVIVLAFALALKCEPRISWLEMPVIVALLAALAIGVGSLLSVLYVRFRDIKPIWEVISQVLFYGSPIIYTASSYESFHPLGLHLLRPAMCNPIATLLTQMGKAFVDPQAHGAAVYIGGAARLAIPLGIIAVLFVLGLWFFSREAPRIAENI